MFAQSMRISPLIAAISLALLAAQAQANDPQPTPKKYVPLFNRMFGSDPSDPSNTTDPDTVAPSKPQTSANAQVTPSNNSAVPSSAVTSAATSIPASTATGSSVASATAARTSTEDLGTSTPSTTTRTAKPKKVKTTQSNTPTNVAGVAAASSVVAANTVTATSDSSVASHVSNSTSLNVQELPEVTVVGNTPIGTQGLAEYKIAGNVQKADAEEVNRHEALSFGISDFMNRRLENVSINDVQGNSYQSDISYRGFTASPLAGTPIGISVYQDGVRINEPFGDTVNWDLIPQVAIASMEMVPGSNPIYGLNTLGGALSVRTKSGFTHSGFHAQAYGGSFGTQNYMAEYGGSSGNFDWYFAGNIFDSSGWRPYSPSAVNQAFAKTGWEDEKTDIDLSFTFSDNNLQGVGGTPQNMLTQNYYSIYTAPDVITNLMYFGTLKGSHKITDQLEVAGNTYFRNNTTTNLNSNTPDTDNCPNGYLNPTYCDNPSSSNPTGTYAATFTNSSTRENGTGGNLQLTSNYKIFDYENQFVLGGGINYAHTNYWQGQNNAVFAPLPYEVGISPYVTTANISGQNVFSNLFASDTFSPTDWLHGSASFNWQQAQVTTFDNLNSGTVNSLAGNNYYSRINPSAGLTFMPLDALGMDSPLKDFTTYFNYNEGMRAPTAMELGCANPNVPCSLPNAMASDPPLAAVIAKTLEFGMRSKITEDMKWNMALYQTRSYNDIQYIPAPQNSNNLGYFSNVGLTQRMGAEFGLSGLLLDSLNWYFSYGFVNATYQTAMTLQAPDPYGAQQVTPGNRIPSIPQNTIKFGSEYEIYKDLFLGGDLQYQGNQYARGDFANQYGTIGGYTVVNLNAKYLITKNIELFAMGRNIFNQHYGNYGQLGQNYFQGNSATTFVGPGAPASGYAGIRVHWD